jgi:hypothetical protein
LRLGKGNDLLPLADIRKELPWVEVALIGRHDVSRAVRHFVPCNTLRVVGVYEDNSTPMYGIVQMIFYGQLRPNAASDRSVEAMLRVGFSLGGQKGCLPGVRK